MGNHGPSDPGVTIDAPPDMLSEEVEGRLATELESCPDVAFAHLGMVTVAGEASSQPSLFVWLVPDAVGSLRAALNLVSEAVARALPETDFLDVLILNSAPELLDLVEENGRLVVERDTLERQRANAASQKPAADELSGERRRLWPW